MTEEKSVQTELLREIREETDRQIQMIKQNTCVELRKKIDKIQNAKWDADLIPHGNECAGCPYLISETVQLIDMFGNKTGTVRTTFCCEWFDVMLAKGYSEYPDMPQLKCYKWNLCKLRDEKINGATGAKLTFSAYPETKIRLNDER